jgi:hypothetical protein
MEDWFESLIKEIVWDGLCDLYADIAGWAEPKIEEKLKELGAATKPLSSSPLVRVIGSTKDDDGEVNTITLLIRGRIPLYKYIESVFMRIELTISTDVDLYFNPPIKIINWHTIIGDLKISKENVFTVNLGLGYDDGTWMGRGAVKIIPAGFGLDLYLGGLTKRGVMIGFTMDIPVAIPLDSTGLGLKGIGGDFAYNFIPLLENSGVEVQNPTAKDYITWARDSEPLARWVEGPIDDTAVGVGVNADLVTLADNGKALKLEPIGLMVLIPGPIFVLGGQGKILDMASAKVEGYLAVDIYSRSMALGLGARFMMPPPKKGMKFQKGEKYIVDAQGTLDAFFSFANPDAWYINLGNKDNKIKAKTFVDVVRAQFYLMLNNYRIAVGGGISYGGKYQWWKITLTARLGADVAALIGWNPVLFEGMLRIWAELGIKIWKFGFSLRGDAEVWGYTKDPTRLEFIFKYKLNLPWPLPDYKGSKKFTLGDSQPSAPQITSPLLAGESTVDEETTQGTSRVGLLHTLTGRQWELSEEEKDACWPDSVIVVPFSCRVIDKTPNDVVEESIPISSPIEGGYVVLHEMNTLQLFSRPEGEEFGTPIEDLKAIWLAGPGGDIAQLHIGGTDPFSWVIPHPGVIENTSETPPRSVEQNFGTGKAENFISEKRFCEMIVEPIGETEQLLTDFYPELPTRVMGGRNFRLKFRTHLGNPIKVNMITLLAVCDPEHHPDILMQPGVFENESVVKSIYGYLELVAYTFKIDPPIDCVNIQSVGSYKEPILLYCVHYQEADMKDCDLKDKLVLSPGKYQILLSGSSQAVYSGTDPDAKLEPSSEVEWSLNKTFKVKSPETLRPYIDTTTIGDSRIFDVDSPPREPAWNPSMHGFGFPIYQQYQPSVRFRVPYMDKIFPKIIMKLKYEAGGEMKQELTPIPNTDGENYLPEMSQKWIQDHCGSWYPDQELTMTSPFSKAGPSAVILSVENEHGAETKLDEWACLVSSFSSFLDHMSWKENSISVFYGPDGKFNERKCGFPETKHPSIDREKIKGNRIDPLIVPRLPATNLEENAGARKKKEEIIGEFQIGDGLIISESIENVLQTDIQVQAPKELTEPLTSWRLSSSLSQHLRKLDAFSGARFAHFALETGARFNNSTDDPLDGISDTVASTTIEAVVDNTGRPYALWLRTPEPVDWRRVSSNLRIAHVTGNGSCPEGYANRHPLILDIEILPSPDGSSAFLIGSQAGCRTRLPRGVYTLTLEFKSKLPDLPTLKPISPIGTTEVVKDTFVQPNGADWPLPQGNQDLSGTILAKLGDEYIDLIPIFEYLIQPSINQKQLRKLIITQRKELPPKLLDEKELERLTIRLSQTRSVKTRMNILAESLPKTRVAAAVQKILRYL